MSFVETALHNKPLLIGGAIVIGGIVLIAATSGGGSSTTTTATAAAGPSDAAIQANAQVQIASIQGGAAASQINGQIALAQVQGQNDLAQQQLAAQLAQYQIDAQTASDSQSNTLNAELQRLQIEAQTHTSDTLAATQAAVAKYTLDQAYASQANNNEFQLSYAEQAGQTSVMMQQIQANVVNNVLTAQYQQQALETNAQYGLAELQTTSQRDVDIAQIGSNTTVAGYQAQIAAYQINATSQLQQSVIAQIPSLRGDNKDDVLETLITGSTAGVGANASKYSGGGSSGNSASAIINSIGSAAGGIAKLASVF